MLFYFWGASSRYKEQLYFASHDFKKLLLFFSFETSLKFLFAFPSCISSVAFIFNSQLSDTPQILYFHEKAFSLMHLIHQVSFVNFSRNDFSSFTFSLEIFQLSFPKNCTSFQHFFDSVCARKLTTWHRNFWRVMRMMLYIIEVKWNF